ncbi:hypothetical protein P6U16_23160 (plasmid) [Rhizobium sp. 32-5/1]|uniref:hypothetical protein n=1 Tax=Rhizobium sp. 32-5/1 TaxID=3019602 RepID=UPI00240D387F|nr:hypothetical protein [Rhizobium sp. 32-5/1]WEZ85891.1 hypothetical protein P6U16_23160 [Rhizobium sp. 32-5/1]
MRKIIQIIGAAAVAVVVGLTTFTPVSAAPFVPAGRQVTSDVQTVQYRHRDDDGPRWKRRYERRHYRAERRYDRRGYWNGHRGYREHRRHRRHYDGYYGGPGFQIIIR